MKIVSWNCNGALRNKTDALDQLDADIFVIQECENPSESSKTYKDWAGNYLWIGETKNKGIGVFPKNGQTVTRLDWDGEFEILGIKSNNSSLKWSTKSLKFFLPFKINNSLNVIGVWTKGKDSQAFGYIGQFWKFLQIHKRDLSLGNQIIIGDFNSNKIWDKSDRWWNHSDVVSELKEIEIVSLYHLQHKEEQGLETKPTFFLHRNEKKPYHIDYIFVSKELINSTVEIGPKETWLALSDHMPLMVNINNLEHR